MSYRLTTSQYVWQLFPSLCQTGASSNTSSRNCSPNRAVGVFDLSKGIHRNLREEFGADSGIRTPEHYVPTVLITVSFTVRTNPQKENILVPSAHESPTMFSELPCVVTAQHGAIDENRTRVASLEDWGATITPL